MSRPSGAPPSYQLVAVVIGLHWAGAVLAVGLFALWCARLPRGGVIRRA